MAFSYNISDSEDKIALLRFQVDDTVEDDAVFTDEEIQRMIDVSDTVEDARVALLRVKKVKLANSAEALTIGGTELKNNIAGQVRAINSADGTLESISSGSRSVPTREDISSGEAT